MFRSRFRFNRLALPRLLAFAAVALLVCVLIAHRAFAQAAAPAVGDIPVAPFVSILQQWLLAIATACMPVLTYWAVQKLSAFLHVKVTETQEQRLESMAATQAGAIIAAGAAGISTEVIHVNDKRIADAVNALPAKAHDLADALGVTPEGLATMIQGKVGALQAVAPQTPPPPADAPK